MLENRRQYYLSLLGLDNYQPRWQLPGARPSEPCGYEQWQNGAATAPLSSDAASNEASNEERAGRQGRSHPPVQTPRLDAGAPEPGTDQPASAARPVAKVAAALERDEAPTPASPNVRPASPAALKFTLSVWRIDDQLLIIDSRPRRLGLPTDALLLNMLRALGLHRERLPAPDVLRWPLTEPGGGLDEARDMVSAYLEAQAGKQPTENLLLMGAAAARAALAAGQWPADDDVRQLLGQRLPVAAYGREARIIPSLAAMLQRPALKAVAWRAIRDLRRD